MALAKTSPVPAAKPAAGASPQHHQERLPVPVFTVHSGGHKAFVQFKSDFKDAKRDVTTQGACSGTIPHRAAAALLSVYSPQQTWGLTGVTTTAHLALLMGMSQVCPGTCPLEKNHHTTENSEPELDIFVFTSDKIC